MGALAKYISCAKLTSDNNVDNNAGKTKEDAENEYVELANACVTKYGLK